MNATDLVQALLEAQSEVGRRALLGLRDEGFYATVVGLLKDRVDSERLRDPRAALQIADIGLEVAAFAASSRCRALAAWARSNVLIHLGDYRECLQLYREAAEFYAAEGAEIEAARLMANQAFLLKNLGRYQEGLEAAEAAAKVLRHYPPSIYYASALNAVGTLCRLLGRYDEALVALGECEQIYGILGEPVRQARATINKVNVLENMDRFTEAISLLDGARIVLADHKQALEVARAELNLGILLTRLGRYDEAVEMLGRAEQEFRALDNQLETSVVALYRADLYAGFNLYDELLEIADRDWQVFEEREMKWQAARAALHQAVAWRKFGRPAKAEDRLVAAAKAFESMGDAIWAQLAWLERAVLWCELGDWARALPVTAEAAAFLDARGMPVRAAGASLLTAQCLLALGRSAEAGECLSGVLDVAERWGARPLLYRVHHALGQVAVEERRLEDALTQFERAVEAVEHLRQGLHVEEFRLGFVEDKLQVYRDAVILCLRLGREEEAFGYVERAKSGALVDLLLARLSQPPEMEEIGGEGLLARLRALREQLNWHHSKLEGGHDGERGKSWSRRETEVWERISAVEHEMTETWRQLQASTPFYASWSSPALHSLDAIQARLQPGEMLIQYYVGGQTIHAFLVDQRGMRACCSLDCTVAQIADAVSALDTTLRGVTGYEADYVDGTLGPLCRRQLGWLYDDLLRPLLPLIQNADRLLVAPDGLLFKVPFHALYDGEHYLLERCEVSYTPSATALWLCQENRHRLVKSRRAGPEAEEPVGAYRPATYAAKGDGMADGQALVMGYSRGRRLPHVRAEIEAVARALPGARILSEDEATLAALQGHAHRSAIVHLATHAVFRHDNPLFSALQLAGGDWLRVMDLYTLRLRGALVTLSACETGRHRLLGGDLLGLSRGFFYAGASALVVSLWPVDDVSTAALMGQFYGHLVAGHTAASALRRAQLDLVESGRQHQGGQAGMTDHPFYWAPFCLLGAPELRLTES